MIKRVDRYIGRTVVLGALTVWLSLTLMMAMFNLLDQLGSANEGYTLFNVIWFVVMTIPRAAYQVFPVSALLGTLIGIGGLAASNELVALRTSGVSRLRISASALAAALLLTLPVMGMGEWIAPAMEAQARAFKHNRVRGQDVLGGPTGIWVREGNNFVNIKQPLLSADRGQTSVLFQEVMLYSFATDGRLQRITRARGARHENGQWILERVRQVGVSPAGSELKRSERLAWESSVKPEILESAVTRPRYMSIRSLLDQLEYLGQNGLDDRVYKSAFWARIFYPLTALALVLAGMPFVFGPARHHNLGVRIFIGMALGSVFVIFNRAVQNLGDAYSMPAFLSTSVPELLLATVAILVLRRSV